MLVIWTKAKPDLLQETLGPIVSGYPTLQYRVALQESIPATGRGDVLLCLGKDLIATLQKGDMLPRNRGIGWMRQQVFKKSRAKLLVSYDPYVKNVDYSQYVDFQIDVALAIRCEMTGSIKPKIGEYRYVKDFTDLIQEIKALHTTTKTRVPISGDLETVSLVPYSKDTYIVTIAFSVKPGKSDVVKFHSGTSMDQPAVRIWNSDGTLGDSVRIVNKRLLSQISWLLNDKCIALRGANWKYDLLWMWVKWGLRCENFTFDTTIVGSLLDENRSNSLSTHAKLHTAMGGYDCEFNLKHDKARMDLALAKDPKEFLTYAGGDTDAQLRVSNYMVSMLKKDDRLLNLYLNLVHPAGRALERMEQVGVLLDVPYYKKLQVDLEEELASLTDKMKKLLPPQLRYKYGGEFSLSRPAIIRDFLFSRTRGCLHLKPKMLTDKTKEPSTAENHLKMFSNVPEAMEVLKVLKEYNSASKTLSTYVIGFMGHLRSDDRWHATAILHKGAFGNGTGTSGTVTGRLAFRDPALQTTPKHTSWAKTLRKGYIAPSGFVWVQWDYSQGELRITACVAEEPSMLKAYRAGIDLHLMTGARLNGYELEEALDMMASPDPEVKAQIKMIRQGGKAGNFGLIYGMMDAGYQIYARDTYGVILTDQEAKSQRDGFFDMYDELLGWHKRAKNIARSTRIIRSPLGRIRHLPLIGSRDHEVRSGAERQAINSPVQSTLSDLTLLSLVKFRERYGDPKDCQFCLTTHDSLGAYVREDKVGVWGPRVKDIMETLPLPQLFGWTPQIPFLVDWEAGPDLASLEKMG